MPTVYVILQNEIINPFCTSVPLYLNSFMPDVPILYLLKTRENQIFSGFSGGIKWETLAKYELSLSSILHYLRVLFYL